LHWILKKLDDRVQTAHPSPGQEQTPRYCGYRIKLCIP